MKKEYNEVYEYLNKINLFDGYVYSRLLSIYDENLVNSVIVKLIDESPSNLVKFDYYVSKIMVYNEKDSKSLYELYGDDLSMITPITDEENIYLINQIQELVLQIKSLFNFHNLEEETIFSEGWICDNVAFFLGDCQDNDKVLQMNKLYNEFLSVRKRMIEGNLRLVIMVAKQFNINESIFIEAIQLGNIGLMRAIEKFSSKYGVAFSTYAYYWIRQSITRGIYDVIYPYSIPAYQVGVYYTYRKCRKKLYDELQREPTVLELADRMNVKVDNVELIQMMFNDPISLYETFGTEEDKDTMLIEFIEDKNSSVFRNLDDLELALTIESSKNVYLTENERMVIDSRYGFNGSDCETLEVIGKKIGRSRERVRQIENKALRKLRVKCKDLADYR